MCEELETNEFIYYSLLYQVPVLALILSSNESEHIENVEPPEDVHLLIFHSIYYHNWNFPGPY